MCESYWARKPVEMSRMLIHGNGLESTAQMLAEFMAPFKLEELEEQGTHYDFDALLRLADIYMYGLNNVAKDGQKAMTYYTHSAAMGSPEACIQVAKIATRPENRSLSKEPISSKDSEFDLYNQTYFLEKTTEYGYVTPFWIQAVYDVKRKNSWPLSKDMEELLEKSIAEHKAFIKSEIDSYKFSCQNSRCQIKTNCESALLVCGQCKLVSELWNF
jgi:TPR repeat protein